MNTNKNPFKKKSYMSPGIKVFQIAEEELLASTGEPAGDSVEMNYSPESDADGGGLSKPNHFASDNIWE